MPGDVGRASGQGRELQGQERVERWCVEGPGLPACKGEGILPGLMVQDLCRQHRDRGVPGSQPMGPGQTWGGSWKEQAGEAEGIPWGAHCPLRLSSPESLLPPPFSWPVFSGGAVDSQTVGPCLAYCPLP